MSAGPAQEQPGALRGRIVVGHGADSVAELPDGRLLRCLTRRRTGRVVCGDMVLLRETAPGEASVDTILARRNVLERTNYRGQSRPLAANLDLLLVVVAPMPTPDAHLLDAYLVLAAQLDAPAIIVCNKADMVEDGDADPLPDLLPGYRELGYPCMVTSSETGQGLAALRAALEGQTAILVGQSGVGKSSLVNRLVPDRQARTQALSRASGQGRHTTTETTLYRLPGDGALIDSPGIRILRLGHLPRPVIEAGFREFAGFAPHCQFRDCSHRDEPDCAVRRAVEDGRICLSRLTSYHRLLDAGLTTASAPPGVARRQR